MGADDSDQLRAALAHIVELERTGHADRTEIEKLQTQAETDRASIHILEDQADRDIALIRDLEAQQRTDHAAIGGLHAQALIDRELITELEAAGAAERAAVANLTIALQTARRIGAAIGILMAQHGINEDQAFGVLKAYSQQTSEKLRDVADRAVDALTSKSPSAQNTASADQG